MSWGLQSSQLLPWEPSVNSTPHPSTGRPSSQVSQSCRSSSTECLFSCMETQALGGANFHDRQVQSLPDRDGGKRPLVYIGKFCQHHSCRSENTIGVQKGVEEINTKKSQVCQPLQEALHTGIADLGHFARVECFTEANVSVIFMKTGIRPTHKAGT